MNANNNGFPMELLSAALQQQPTAQVQAVSAQNGDHNFGGLNFSTSSASAFQIRSSSVIVSAPPPPNVPRGPKKNGKNAEIQQSSGIGLLGKRARQAESPPKEAEEKVPKLEAQSGGSEVLGVNRFISPFSAEAKIPLPHELNELSAHGTTVWKRNERERQRVRCVNEGYVQLRGQLPLTEQDRRLSKVDTLRLAIAYIHHLELLIAIGRAHQLDCQCFNNYNSTCGDGSSAENTPPPN